MTGGQRIDLIGVANEHLPDVWRDLGMPAGYVERLGITKIRAIDVDDSEGIAADLDRALEESVEATYDPWLERDKPVTPNQFRHSLRIVRRRV